MAGESVEESAEGARAKEVAKEARVAKVTGYVLWGGVFFLQHAGRVFLTNHGVLGENMYR